MPARSVECKGCGRGTSIAFMYQSAGEMQYTTFISVLLLLMSTVLLHYLQIFTQELHALKLSQVSPCLICDFLYKTYCLKWLPYILHDNWSTNYNNLECFYYLLTMLTIVTFNWILCSVSVVLIYGMFYSIISTNILVTITEPFPVWHILSTVMSGQRCWVKCRRSENFTYPMQ